VTIFEEPQAEENRMTRQNRIGRLVRVFLLLGGASLLATGVSCGDQLRQTVIDTGTAFVGTAMTQVLEAALGSALGVSSQG
jgi:hypothetical protein